MGSHWAPQLVLGLMSMLIIGRCIRIAPTFGWKLALIGLLAAIALPDTALIGIARNFELRWESRYASAHDHSLDDVPLKPETYQRLLKATPPGAEQRST
jgi:hypothetical protein